MASRMEHLIVSVALMEILMVQLRVTAPWMAAQKVLGRLSEYRMACPRALEIWSDGD
jgi:hypothetical protein